MILLNNPLSYPIQQLAGQTLGYEYFISKEYHDDHLTDIKRKLVSKIHNEFDFRNKNTSIRLSDKVGFEIIPIKSDGYDYIVAAFIETIFKRGDIDANKICSR